ncbi:Lon protease [Bacteroidia bacterium]|nr:Lon protease [Bacteroidia bacterium]GHT80264.1 Lon protease [Bacteroidia bacterium]
MSENKDIIPMFGAEDEGVMNTIPVPAALPVLALRNAVLFPSVIIPINLSREKSVKLVNTVFAGDKNVAVVMQKDTKVEDPRFDELHTVGVAASVVRVIEMPDGSTTVLLQGLRRIALKELVSESPYFVANIEALTDTLPAAAQEYNLLIDSIRDVALRIVQMLTHLANEASFAIKNITNKTFLINYLATNIEIESDDKQKLLEISDVEQRAKALLETLLKAEGAMLVKRDIQKKASKDIDKHQREYVLQQQMKAIQDELGGNTVNKEAIALREKAKGKKWNKKTAELFEKELKKLEMMHPYSPEFPPQANYLQVLVELPWDKYSKDDIEIAHAQKVLDEDHFGLEEVKERILEHLSVMKLKRDFKAPILCLYGPPGVGKTSLGKSVARAMGREFARISLGGLHDESEIRGHRKTYIGAMPGRIIQTLRKCKTGNPVIVLDEIDKVGNDFRGDPSSALLEVLDPEQNTTFYDNFLELEYDLSRIMFLTTANNVAVIHPALRDRMEIINVSGYTQEEKVQIAQHYLIPRLLENHGIKPAQLQFSNEILQRLIEDYTHESGVRGLEKQLSKTMRKVTKHIALKESYEASITQPTLVKMLGVPKFSKERASESSLVGVVTGLAWTQNGGEILFIEASINKGKGMLTTTGNLGDVMKESAVLAFEYVKSQADYLKINPELFAKNNLHIHVPEGAIPKDGPSAGVAMITAIASVFANRKVRHDIAMTGEITLRGITMPIGGVKEKILAAKRAGITTLILPEENRKNIEEIKPEYLTGLTFIYAKTLHEVLENALE